MILVKEELGKDWLTTDRFRIGASSLLQDIGNEIMNIYRDKLRESVSEEKISKSEEKKSEEKKKDNEEKKEKTKKTSEIKSDGKQ